MLLDIIEGLEIDNGLCLKCTNSCLGGGLDIAVETLWKFIENFEILGGIWSSAPPHPKFGGDVPCYPF